MESSREQKTVPLDYACAADGPRHRRTLDILLMYALPTAVSTICFWIVTGKLGGGVALTGCLFTGPLFLPLFLHFKSTEFMFMVAGPGAGFVILAGWLALVMWTPLRRMPLLVHLILCVAWMFVAFACVCQTDS
ncbi:MAG: hypothetical protein JWL69_3972 [Phycisphaerales bacterium]|nr:hypothetical protein [Phycisphaerales bacterium]